MSELRTFTVEQANASLPLVRRVAADMVEVGRDLTERRRHLKQLTAGRDLGADDPYGSELVQIEQELNKDAARLQGYIDEIVELGAVAEDPLQGLIDFPSLLDGRVINLCWKFDEPEVLFWHERHEGAAARNPLTADTAADADAAEGRDLLEP